MNFYSGKSAAALVLSLWCWGCVGLNLPSGTDVDVLPVDPIGGPFRPLDPNGNPQDPLIQINHGATIMGRTLPQNDDLLLAWSGTSVLLTIQGTGIGMYLRSNVGNRMDRPTYDVYVDDTFSQRITGTMDNQAIPLASNLANGTHQLRITRRVEPNFGTDIFGGFALDNGTTLLAPPTLPERRFIFLGDSTMAGWGVDVEAKNDGNHCQNNATNQDAQQTYAWLIAEQLQAQVQIIAISGKGLLRNRAPNFEPNFTMAWHYNHTLANVGSNAVAWDHKRYPPDMVVSNLSGNDFATSAGNPPLDSNAWQMAHSQLVAQIRQSYPKALIVLAIGPTIHGGELALARQTLQNYVATANDPDLAFLEMPEENGSLLYACNFHASKARHQLMASKLMEVIGKLRPTWLTP